MPSATWILSLRGQFAKVCFSRSRRTRRRRNTLKLAGTVERLESYTLTGNFGLEAVALGGGAFVAFGPIDVDPMLRSDLSSGTLASGSLSSLRVTPADGSFVNVWDTLSTTSASNSNPASTGSTSTTTPELVTDSRPASPFNRSDLASAITSNLSAGLFGNALFDAFDDFDFSTSTPSSSKSRSRPLSRPTSDDAPASSGAGGVYNSSSGDDGGPAATVAAGNLSAAFPSASDFGFASAMPRSAASEGNQAPIAVDDSFAVTYSDTLTIAPETVLANDSDPDGDPLTATFGLTANHGTVTLNADGSITYAPNAGFVGEDLLIYVVADPYGLTDSGDIAITVFGTSGGGSGSGSGAVTLRGRKRVPTNTHSSQPRR